MHGHTYVKFIQRILITNITPGSKSYIKIAPKTKKNIYRHHRRKICIAICNNTFALLVLSGFQSMNTNSCCTPSNQQKSWFHTRHQIHGWNNSSPFTLSYWNWWRNKSIYSLNKWTYKHHSSLLLHTLKEIYVCFLTWGDVCSHSELFDM